MLIFQGLPESPDDGKESASSARSELDSCDSEGTITCSAEIKFAIFLKRAKWLAGRVLKRGTGVIKK